MSKAHFGLIGLGVMGENLVLNAERNGFSSVVYNRTFKKTEEFLLGRGLGKAIEGAKDLEELVSKLENISPSLEPSHAFAEAIKIAPKLKPSDVIIVNSCGDSLKDKDIIKKKLGSYIR